LTYTLAGVGDMAVTGRDRHSLMSMVRAGLSNLRSIARQPNARRMKNATPMMVTLKGDAPGKNLVNAP
jgi:hypothetical protein